MKSIVAIRYRDALYSTSKKIKDTILPIYVAVGSLTISNNHIIVSFTEENGTVTRGLLVPNEALISQEDNISAKFDILQSLNQSNSTIGVFWKDIVYFENGEIPDRATQTYTEGRLFLQTSDAVIIKDPETITIQRNNVDNHPKVKSTFFIIPKALITGIESYGEEI